MKSIVLKVGYVGSVQTPAGASVDVKLVASDKDGNKAKLILHLTSKEDVGQFQLGSEFTLNLSPYTRPAEPVPANPGESQTIGASDVGTLDPVTIPAAS